MTARPLRETKLAPSDLRAEAQRLISIGRMPSLADVVEAIRVVKRNPDHLIPVIHDALVRTEGELQ